MSSLKSLGLALLGLWVTTPAMAGVDFVELGFGFSLTESRGKVRERAHERHGSAFSLDLNIFMPTGNPRWFLGVGPSAHFGADSAHGGNLTHWALPIVARLYLSPELTRGWFLQSGIGPGLFHAGALNFVGASLPSAVGYQFLDELSVYAGHTLQFYGGAPSSAFTFGAHASLREWSWLELFYIPLLLLPHAT